MDKILANVEFAACIAVPLALEATVYLRRAEQKDWAPRKSSMLTHAQTLRQLVPLPDKTYKYVEVEHLLDAAALATQIYGPASRAAHSASLAAYAAAAQFPLAQISARTAMTGFFALEAIGLPYSFQLAFGQRYIKTVLILDAETQASKVWWQEPKALKEFAASIWEDTEKYYKP